MKPYVKSNKNDAADAEAICEAVSRPNMRFVPVKQIEQQDIQCLHRVRERLVKARTALVNEIRGLLGEYGIIIPQKIAHVRQKLPGIIEEPEMNLTSMTRALFSALLTELRSLDEKILDCDEKVGAIHKSHPVCKRLSKIPGVGPLTATAMIAAVSDPSAFKNGQRNGGMDWAGA